MTANDAGRKETDAENSIYLFIAFVSDCLASHLYHDLGLT